MSKGEPQGAAKITADTCIHEATGFLAERILRWQPILREASKRMRELDKQGELPEWATHDNVESAAMVAVLRALTALIGVAHDQHPDLFSTAQEILAGFAVDEETCDALAKFLLGNESMRLAFAKQNREIIQQFWENN